MNEYVLSAYFFTFLSLLCLFLVSYYKYNKSLKKHYDSKDCQEKN